MIWPFSKKVAVEEGTVLVSNDGSGEVVVEPEPKEKKVVIPPYGEQFNGLTRFGTIWMNLSDVTLIEFNPPDGCGAEVVLKGRNEEWHFGDENASALRAYLEGMDKVKSDIES